MGTFKNKKTIKNLIIIIAIITFLSALVPKPTMAKTETENGGKILTPIEDLVLFVCDSIMGWLQKTFTSTDGIEVRDNVWEFKYSPAIIFSGTVPALDINFINPGADIDSGSNITSYIKGNEEKFRITQSIDTDEYNQKLAELNTRGYSGSLENREYTYNGKTKLKYNIYYYVEETSTNEQILVVETFGEYGSGIGSFFVRRNYVYGKQELSIVNGSIDGTVVKYESTAKKLQGTIATWYNALRKIALIGLLSVLVYVGIRIVMTSSSGDKAKYKAMLKDWLVAICLLFTLHYIMSITITVVNEISKIFQTGESDVLLNTLRETIYSEKDRAVILANTIMYAMLTILTITFTIQYLKRVIFMAFYTLVAPLITLTYPLDKIKDGQAQAFNMWIKEYIYTALVQVIHLVIYTVLVGSALDLVASYPLYAIIVLMFIKKADGIVKKMFGLDKSETVGTLGAAAAGALVVNAFNKIGGKGGPKKGGSPEKPEGAGSNTVRTASNTSLNDALTSLKGGGNITPPEKKGSKASGAGAVVKKYAKPTLGALAGAATGAAGGILGFAAGAVQGDLTTAIAGATAGRKAGSNIGHGAVNLGASVLNSPKTVTNAVNNLTDTFNEGAYGSEYAGNVKAVRDFKESSAYSALKDKYGDEFTDDKLSVILQAGITDKNKMNTILDSGLDLEQALKYNTIAEHCPMEILYNTEMMKTFCSDLRKRDTSFAGLDDEKISENVKLFI